MDDHHERGMKIYAERFGVPEADLRDAFNHRMGSIYAEEAIFTAGGPAWSDPALPGPERRHPHRSDLPGRTRQTARRPPGTRGEQRCRPARTADLLACHEPPSTSADNAIRCANCADTNSRELSLTQTDDR